MKDQPFDWFIDYFVSNANFSSISAISWRDYPFGVFKLFFVLLAYAGIPHTLSSLLNSLYQMHHSKVGNQVSWLLLESSSFCGNWLSQHT